MAQRPAGTNNAKASHVWTRQGWVAQPGAHPDRLAQGPQPLLRGKGTGVKNTRIAVRGVDRLESDLEEFLLIRRYAKLTAEQLLRRLDAIHARIGKNPFGAAGLVQGILRRPR